MGTVDITLQDIFDAYADLLKQANHELVLARAEISALRQANTQLREKVEEKLVKEETKHD